MYDQFTSWLALLQMVAGKMSMHGLVEEFVMLCIRPLQVI